MIQKQKWRKANKQTMKTLFKLFVFIFLITVSVNLTAQENKFLQREFWNSNPSIAEIDALITEGNDITERNAAFFDGPTYAILQKVDPETIAYIISKEGNGVDKLTHDGRIYLHWAAYSGNKKVVDKLLAKGSDAAAIDAHGYSVVNFSANAGLNDTTIYDALLAKGADLNSTTHNGANALLLAASNGKDLGIINYLSSHGLKLSSTDNLGNGVFTYAARSGNISLLKTLKEKGVDYRLINKEGENALFSAARGTRRNQNGLAVFTYLEGLGLSNQILNTKGQNLLHLLASRNKDVALFEHLINSGLDVNLADSEGNTPFMLASQNNNLEIIKLLAQKVDKINTVNNKGQSALHLATQDNSVDVIRFLVAQGVNIKATDNDGNSLALYWLESYRPRDMKEFNQKKAFLAQSKVDFKASQHNDNTLIHLAAKENNLKLLKQLEDFSIPINQKNNEGNTALHLAALSANNDEILKYLISRGADVSAKTDFEETVFDLASENELLEKNQVELDFLKL
ncbi:hypothetical protein GCM10011414_08860 [Croceivirga lutea]|nr:hypothetical protein GCM10011414_08860 [Croceivirga lutea]